MVLTEADAAEVNRSILERLREIGAREVLDGIDESRQLGIEEIVSEQEITSERKRAKTNLREVARTRKRPPNASEVLRIILDRLSERLVTLPSLRASISKRLGTENVVWRVDTEFVTPERIPEVHLEALAPSGLDDVNSRWKGIQELLANSAVPKRAE